MTARADIVMAGRRWIGTPTLIRGRARGRGVDCIGIALGIVGDLGMPQPPVIPYYGDLPDPVFVRSLLDGYMTLAWDSSDKAPAAPKPAQLGLFGWSSAGAIHMGVITDMAGGTGLLHAYMPLRKVVEHGLSSAWLSRLTALFEFPGVED